MRWSERQIAMLREMGAWPWAGPADGGPSMPFGAASADIAARTGEGSSTGSARTEALPVPAGGAARSTAEPARSTAAVAQRAADGTSRAGAVAGSERTAGAPTQGPVLRQRPAGIDSMDWTQLRAAVADCTACKLCSGRRQTVFGVGHPRAHWMIVGEAPGEQEDIQGEPFVGKSGQLLDNMLRALGLSRHEPPAAAGQPAADAAARQVYIANTLKCRPPGNRNPQPDELAQCEPFLVRQIELVQPKIILAMGRFAVQSLLRSNEPIGRLRGRVHRYQGVPLIVTYHPAYLLRNLQDKARAWDDLCLAAETADGAPAAQ